MSNPYATAFKQQDFPENFRFYFKNQQLNPTSEVELIQGIVRPRLKIALVTETWPPEINGVALSLLQLCKGLQQQGHKILLIRPHQHQSCPHFTPNRECLVVSQAIPRYPGLHFGWPQYLKVSQALDDFKPHVVHIVTEGPLGLTALQTAKSAGIPVSSGFHSPFQDFSRFFDLAFLVKPVQKYLCWFHNSTQLTCIPSKDTEQLLKDMGVSCPLKVIARGVDPQQFNPEKRSEQLRKSWGVTADTKVLLYVGRLSPEKEVDVLIESHARLYSNKESSPKLVIVGDGPDRSRLQKMVQNSNVIFTGNLSGEVLATTYASADVFAFASQVETFGNVVLEAMASGLPVIAYDYACAHVYVEHGQTGWLSPLKDINGLSRAIENLPENTVLRTMGLNARKRVQHAGWQQPVQQLEQALYQVVQESVMTT
ncbi:glycosyltransferase family 4 protein [Acinetobacter radioresistens]|uniref:glycosyltransferase family 4 protein n=1 Tax=Acinetobacter radioresistens TaxID=40216 RepID=UPI000E7276C6|nr:glycosyltransferase family 1 protein [Acinetobacter radioresistens]RJL74306.1 glycosyltransferase family 1 protein [Acinetobacter radioresistens]